MILIIVLLLVPAPISPLPLFQNEDVITDGVTYYQVEVVGSDYYLLRYGPEKRNNTQHYYKIIPLTDHYYLYSRFIDHGNGTRHQEIYIETLTVFPKVIP